MSKKEYDFGERIAVKKSTKERLRRLKRRYEEQKSPFLDLSMVDFVDKVLDLAFGEIEVDKEAFEEAFKEAFEEEEGGD